jgi:acyl dehydratase
MDVARLRGWVFPEVERAYTDRDTMLYALGLGLGADPTDPGELPFVTERGLRTLPTMAAVVGRQPPWLAEAGVKVTDAVHGEQRMAFARPLPPEGRVRTRSRVAELVDKGPGRGALLAVEQAIADAATGEPLCTAVQTVFIRGAGGFGGPPASRFPARPVPARPPDAVHDHPTLPQTALLYRLSGDRNPLHWDPATARAAGFPRPILHGLCTYGIAGWQVVRTLAGGDPDRLAALDVRFAAPALPGETLRTELWRDGGEIAFQTRVRERDVVALSHGRAVLRP